jgi:hypothetical protein
MERTHLKAKSAALRIYPRLASKPKLKHSAATRPITNRRRAAKATSCDPPAVSPAALRLRLFKMIVENEKLRRQEPHAS